MFFVRQNATHKLVIGPAVAVGDGFTPVTNLAISTADEAEAILHDNATVVDISAYTFAAIATADGYYHLTLAAGITSTVGHVTIVINDDSLILPLRTDYTVIEEAVYDALFASTAPGYLQPTVAARTLDVNATGEVGLDLDNTSGTLDAAQLGADCITSAKIADDAISSEHLNTGCLTADAFAANALVAATFAASSLDGKGDWNTTTPLDAAGIATAVWNAATATYGSAGSYGLLIETNLDAAMSTRSSHSEGDVVTAMEVVFLTDPWESSLPGEYNAGQAGYILGTFLTQAVFNPASDKVTLADGVTHGGSSAILSLNSVTSGGSCTFAQGFIGDITGNITGDLQGDVTGAIGGVNTGGITSDSFDSNSITAAALAADAVAEINATVDAALQDIHLDHLLAADYDPSSKPGVATALLNELIENDGGVSRFTTNSLENAVAEIIGTALTESYGTDGSALTLTQFMYLILANVSEFAISGTTKTCKKLDGSTTAATYTLDDGDEPTSITRSG